MECCRYSCVLELASLIPVPGVAAAFVAGCKIAQGIAKVAATLGDASPIISSGLDFVQKRVVDATEEARVRRWVRPEKELVASDRAVWLAPLPPPHPTLS